MGGMATAIRRWPLDWVYELVLNIETYSLLERRGQEFRSFFYYPR